MENQWQKQSFWHSFFLVFYPFLIGLSLWVLNRTVGLPKKIPIFDFFILSLATFRLIRLFVYDDITEHVRGYLHQFEIGLGKELRNLLDCPWCTGIWMALFTSFFYFFTPFAWYPLLILALAGAGTFIQITIIKIGKDL
jgi:hypothetical protein